MVLPTRRVAERFGSVIDAWEELTAREQSAQLPLTREPDPLFADIVWRWGAGVDLDETLGESELTAGDFVRSVKQVADLLRQIRDAYEGTALGERAAEAARRLIRGVVAHSGL